MSRPARTKKLTSRQQDNENEKIAKAQQAEIAKQKKCNSNKMQKILELRKKLEIKKQRRRLIRILIYPKLMNI